MYVTRVPNRGSPPAILLRESYRAGGKVRTRTLANLSRWPEAKIEALRRVLKDEAVVAPPERLAIERSLPHGHVAAVLGLARKLGLDRLVPRRPERLATLALALVVARVLEPAAKLATARQLSEPSAAHSLGAVLGLGAVDEDELYRALDLLGGAQAKIEATLARRHLANGCLVLYDLTSSWLEGRCCELARFGYSRDGQRAKLLIVFGLLCTAEGCPIAIEVFEGDTADPATLAAQVAKLKERFKLGRVVLVGDRGMITAARIAQDLKPAGLDWITALRAPAIQALAAEGGPCSCRCSISGIWRRSPRPTIRASAWWSAATPIWRPSGRASGRRCWRRPSRIWRRSWPPRGGRARRCAVARRSRSRSAPCSADVRWPSTLA